MELSFSSYPNAGGRIAAQDIKSAAQLLTPEVQSVLRGSGEWLFAVSHDCSQLGGWWRDPKTGADLKAEVNDPASRFGKALVAEKLCLIHSEVSEAMEGHRKNKQDEHLPHRKSIEVELADAVIRIGDLAVALDLDIAGAIVEKLVYNAQRADHKAENRAAEGGKAY